MAITLYSSVVCPWAARTWLAMVESGLHFELVEVDLTVPREPWYLEQINPVGKVPALKLDDGHVICESSVCTEYMADLTQKFLPNEPFQRSSIKFFIETFIAKFPPAMYSIATSTPEKSAQLIHAAVASVNKLLQDYLQDGPFLLGSPEYTLAELDCVPFLARFDLLGRKGFLPGTLFEDVMTSKDFALFQGYLKNCLSRKSHLAIWNEQAVYESALRRLKPLRVSTNDCIFVKDLRLMSKVGLSSFAFAEKSFPINISVSVRTEPVEPGSDDYAISYGDVARDFTRKIDEGSFTSLEDLASTLIDCPRVADRWQTLKVEKEGGLLRADKEILEVTSSGDMAITIKGIRLGCIIGVYDHERVNKQDVLIEVTMTRQKWNYHQESQLRIEHHQRRMLAEVIDYVEKSSLRTVEALAQNICEISLRELPESVEALSVWISKPSALITAKHSGVSITRKRSDMKNP